MREMEQHDRGNHPLRRKCQEQPCRDSECEQHHDPTYPQKEYSNPRSSQRHPDADLARPHLYLLADQSIDSHHSEQNGKRSKDTKKPALHSLHHELIADDLLHRFRCTERQRRIDVVNDRAQRGDDAPRVAGGAYHQICRQHNHLRVFSRNRGN